MGCDGEGLGESVGNLWRWLVGVVVEVGRWGVDGSLEGDGRKGEKDKDKNRGVEDRGKGGSYAGLQSEASTAVPLDVLRALLLRQSAVGRRILQSCRWVGPRVNPPDFSPW